MWPYNGALELANWNIGTEISGCAFKSLSGIAVRIHGAKNLVTTNLFLDCVTDVTDYGAIYCGRSLVQLQNVIDNNVIQGVKWRGRAEQERVEGSLEDDVCGVYLDDYMCGTTVSANGFGDCQTGIMSNGGRFNLMRRNYFGTGVEFPLRTNVGRGRRIGTLGSSTFDNAYLSIGTFRYWDESNHFARSNPNQLFAELRNLYMACQYGQAAGYNVFADSTAWVDAQSQGAYLGTYQPTNEPDRKDLQHLVAKLSNATSGQPSWANSDGTATYTDDGKNSLRRIQYPFVSNADWFLTATSATVSGIPDRKWLVDYLKTTYSAIPYDLTILKNYGNVWVWNDFDYANLSKRPVTAHRVYFRSYRPTQPSTMPYMDDEVGYYSFNEPNNTGNE